MEICVAYYQFKRKLQTVRHHIESNNSTSDFSVAGVSKSLSLKYCGIQHKWYKIKITGGINKLIEISEYFPLLTSLR